MHVCKLPAFYLRNMVNLKLFQSYFLLFPAFSANFAKQKLQETYLVEIFTNYYSTDWPKQNYHIKITMQSIHSRAGNNGRMDAGQDDRPN